MKPLNEKELDLAREIVSIGLAKAADALSFFTRDKVMLSHFDLHIRQLSNIDQINTKEGNNVHVALTQLIGEISGACGLLFSETEADNLLRVVLPPKIYEDPEKRAMMGEAMLLEIDNITTAAVITQFSNFLQFNMFGGVPQLQRLSGRGVDEYLLAHAGNPDYLLCFTTSLSTHKQAINPSFVWLLEYKFLEGIRTASKLGEQTSILMKRA